MYEEFVNKKYIESEANYSRVYSYLDKYMDSSNKEYLPINMTVEIDRTIWIMWYQGLEEAPLIVKRCISSIERYKPKGYNIVILSAANLSQYVEIPEYILLALEEGNMSLTHFSDLIRLYLLVEYGGIWIDSTVYLCGEVPAFMYTGLFLFNNVSVTAVPVIKNSSWWISAEKNDYILSKTLNLLENYWRNERDLIEYFLLHIAMAKVINEDLRASAEYKKVPCFSNLNAHYFASILEKTFLVEEYDKVKQISPVQKLTYKRRYIRGDLYTFYDAIINEQLS